MNEEAELVVITNGKDEDGFPVKNRELISVFAREKSIARTEFYEAHRSNVNVKIALEMRIEDWEMSRHIVDGKPEYASKIIYDGCEYDVVRTYQRNKSMIQVVCG